MPDGTKIAVTEGTPQGGPLSPLLSNIVLDEWDRELQRRGHRFVRYADDCNIFVRSARAGGPASASWLRSGFLERRLRLKVNEEKSGVRPPHEVHVPGFRFQCRRIGEGFRNGRPAVGEGGTAAEGHGAEMTPPNWGRSLAACMKDLSRYLNGWWRTSACVRRKPSTDCGRSTPTSAAVSERSSSAGESATAFSSAICAPAASAAKRPTGRHTPVAAVGSARTTRD